MEEKKPSAAETEPLVQPFSLRDEYLDSVDIKELLLRPAEHIADYAAMLTCIASPLDTQALRGLANIIRNEAEPHVHTRIPRDGLVRTERKADQFPHVQDRLAVELRHAYWLLMAFEGADSEKRREFEQEGDRIERLFIEKFTPPMTEKEPHIGAQHLFNIFNFVIMMVRKFSRFYLAAAWYMLMDAHGKFEKEAQQNAKSAIEGYQNALEMLEHLAAGENDIFRFMASRGISQDKDTEDQKQSDVLLKFIQMTMRKNSEQIGHAEREFYSHFILGEHRALMQDVLFGAARAHCLLGDHVNAAKAADRFEAELKSPVPGSEPSPIIIESMHLLEEEMRKNPGQPFVPASPKIMHEAMQCVIRHYGRGPNRIWMPGDERPPGIRAPLIKIINYISKAARAPESREAAPHASPDSRPILQKMRDAVAQLVNRIRRVA